MGDFLLTAAIIILMFLYIFIAITPMIIYFRVKNKSEVIKEIR